MPRPVGGRPVAERRHDPPWHAPPPRSERYWRPSSTLKVAIWPELKEHRLQPARPLRLLRRAPRAGPHDARPRAARLAARGPREHEGALERPRAADGFAPLNGQAVSPPRFSGAGADNSEGYVVERQQIIDWAVEHRTPNFVVLTGDTHRNWVRNIPRHCTSLENPMGVEFLGTSVSTGGDVPDPELIFGLAHNPQLLMRNDNRGYCKCTLTPDTWTSEYRIVSTVRRPRPPFPRWRLRRRERRAGGAARGAGLAVTDPWGGRAHAPAPHARHLARPPRRPDHRATSREGASP